jgi:hypothetical protein
MKSAWKGFKRGFLKNRFDSNIKQENEYVLESHGGKGHIGPGVISLIADGEDAPVNGRMQGNSGPVSPGDFDLKTDVALKTPPPGEV